MYPLSCSYTENVHNNNNSNNKIGINKKGDKIIIIWNKILFHSVVSAQALQCATTPHGGLPSPRLLPASPVARTAH